MTKITFKTQGMLNCVEEFLAIGDKLCDIQKNITELARSMDSSQRPIKNIRNGVCQIEVGRSGNKFTQFASVTRECSELYRFNEKRISDQIDYTQSVLDEKKSNFDKQDQVINGSSLLGAVSGSVFLNMFNDIKNVDFFNKNERNPRKEAVQSPTSPILTEKQSKLEEFTQKNPECESTVKALQKLGMKDDEIISLIQDNSNYKNAMDQKLYNMLNQRNQEFTSKAGSFGKNSCVNLTYAKMKHYVTDGNSPTYADGFNSSGNGKDVFTHLADTAGQSNLVVTQTKYEGNDCLQKIIDVNNGEPVMNVIVSFPKSGSGSSTYGHVVFIDAIVDGKVYWTDNHDATKVNVRSIDGFLSWYEYEYNKCGSPIGAIVMTKNV